MLRGPQGTLFGKNTTAGAINVTTRKPSFTPETDFELNYGNLGFVQAKASVTGPLFEKVAGRLSFSGTQRDGTVQNTTTQRRRERSRTIWALRGQLLFAPSDKLAITRGRGPHAPAAGRLHAGGRRRRADAAPANRQYPQIAADLGYTAPSFNAFDRLTDVDTPLRSYQDLGGASLTVDWKLGRAG